MTKHPKCPRDLNQWAKRMVDIATGEAEALPTIKTKTEVAALGGKSRAERLPRERRTEIAKKAARARWKEPT